MAWPLVKLIPKKTHFGFVRFAFFASFVSIALVLASFGSMISAGYRENPVDALSTSDRYAAGPSGRRPEPRV